MSYLWEIEMCHFREIEMCLFLGIEMCYFQEIEIYHFREIKILFEIEIKIQFWGDWKVHLEITLLEFIFIKLLVFLKTILKAIQKTVLLFFYYYSINPSQVRPPFGFLLVIFFFCKSCNLGFFSFYFYALRHFLANFQGHIVSSDQKLFKTAWKQMLKKAKKSQNFSKIESDEKEHIKLSIVFTCLKVSYYLGLKAWKVFKLIAFMVLERFLEGHIWPPPHSRPSLPYTERIHRGHMEKG